MNHPEQFGGFAAVGFLKQCIATKTSEVNIALLGTFLNILSTKWRIFTKITVFFGKSGLDI